MMKEDDVEILLNSLLDQLLSHYIIFQFGLAKEKDELCCKWKDRNKFDVTKN